MLNKMETKTQRMASGRTDVHKRERRNFRDNEKRWRFLERSKGILMRVTEMLRRRSRLAAQ
jgi:hypothetical protein